MHTQEKATPYNSYSITLLAHMPHFLSAQSCDSVQLVRMPHSFLSILWLCTSSVPTGCCSCVFGAGLEPHPFWFHLLMQTVSNTPHTVPVMNITSEQTTAVMATAVAVDRLVSVVKEVIMDRRIRCINVYT